MLNVKIPLQQESETSVQLEGDLTVPTSIANNAKGIVVFAHGAEALVIVQEITMWLNF